MTNIGTIIALIADAVLLAFFFQMYRKNRLPHDVIEDLHEERQIIKAIQSDTKNMAESTVQECKKILSKITQLGAEIEQEFANSHDIIQKSTEEVAGELLEKLGQPIGDLSEKQKSFENLLAKLTKEKNSLQSLIKKTESLVALINAKAPVDDILRNIEEKKYSDIRMLLAQGLSPAKIAKELNVLESEVELVRDLAYQA